MTSKIAYVFRKEETFFVLLWILVSSGLLVLFSMHVKSYFFLKDDFALVGEAGRHGFPGFFGQALLGFYRPLVFCMLKVQHLLFNWSQPGGYAAVSILIHLLNVLLMALLVRVLFPGDRMVLLLSTLFFMLSPWAGESYFWISCQFDLFAAMGMLSALLLSFKSLDPACMRVRVLLYSILSCVCALLALFSKEEAVILPVLVLLLVLLRRGDLLSVKKHVTHVVVLVSFCVLFYLYVRSRIIGAFEGPYGDFFSLLKKFRPHRLMHVFLFPPTSISQGVIHIIAEILYAFLAVASLISALYYRRRESILIFLACFVTLLPVSGFKISRFSMAEGRYLYIPGVFMSMFFALGFRGMSDLLMERKNRLLHPAFCRAGVFIFLLSIFVSCWYQQGVWNTAFYLSRRCIAQFSENIGKGKRFYITNLPGKIQGGPRILCSYAFTEYFLRDHSPAQVSQVRADLIRLSLRGNVLVPYAKKTPDPFSQYEKKGKGEVVLTFDLR